MLRFAERIDSMKTIPQLVLTGTGERDTEDIVDLHDSLVVGREEMRRTFESMMSS